jgi:hypothetical protein
MRERPCESWSPVKAVRDVEGTGNRAPSSVSLNVGASSSREAPRDGVSSTSPTKRGEIIKFDITSM